MPKVSPKSTQIPLHLRRKKEDEEDKPSKSEDDKPSNTEDDDVKESVVTDNFDGLVKFESMDFQNPYANIYSKALVDNFSAKESALRNLQIDELKEKMKIEVEKMKPKPIEKPRKISPSKRSSPYSMRERKTNINYREIHREKGPEKVANTVVPLRRISLRHFNKPTVSLANVSGTTDGSVSDFNAPVFRRGKLKMDEVLMGADDEENCLKDMKMLGQYLAAEVGEKKIATTPRKFSWIHEIDQYEKAKRCWSYPREKENLDKFKENVSKLRMWCGTLGRVLNKRVTSMAVHPSKDSLLISAGGKDGSLGIWTLFPPVGEDITKKEADVGYRAGIHRFNPHDGVINCTTFCRFYGDRLITSSYDGTVRSLNLEKLVFDQLYGSPEDWVSKHWMQWHCQLSPNVLLASQGTGNVYVIDGRSKNEYDATLNCYEYSCRTVDIHPLYPQYLATSSSCGYSSIWDLRKFKRAKKNSSPESEIRGVVASDAAICHLGDKHRKLFSAFFSPVTGSGLLTTSSDDHIRLYDTSTLVKESCPSKYRVETSIRHRNRTGRWLTTFRAAWHPQRDDAFVVGSLDHPRQVEVYGKHGRLLASIGKDGPLPIHTVCSVNVFHPNRHVLASADSVGRVHVFM